MGYWQLTMLLHLHPFNSLCYYAIANARNAERVRRSVERTYFVYTTTITRDASYVSGTPLFRNFVAAVRRDCYYLLYTGVRRAIRVSNDGR